MTALFIELVHWTFILQARGKLSDEEIDEGKVNETSSAVSNPPDVLCIDTSNDGMCTRSHKHNAGFNTQCKADNGLYIEPGLASYGWGQAKSHLCSMN